MNMDIWAEYIVMVLVLLFTVCILAFTPYYTNRGSSFGVSVPESEYDNPKLAKLRRSYRNGVLLSGGVLTAATLIGMSLIPNFSIIAAFVCLIIIVPAIVLYVSAYKKVKVIKEEENWQQRVSSKIVVELSSGELHRLPSMAWSLLYWAIAAITATITFVAYPNMPDVIPQNYNMAGEVTSFAPKTISTVSIIPATIAIMALIFTFVLFVIRKSRAPIAVDNKEESLQRNTIFRRAWSIFTLIMGSGLSLLFLLIQLAIIGFIPSQSIMVATLLSVVVIFAGVIGLIVRYGQGGSLVRAKDRKDSQVISAKDDDRYWKWGAFYYNPDDPALFVEKRFGIGWTSNFARPLTWVFVGALLLFIVGALVLTYTQI